MNTTYDQMHFLVVVSLLHLFIFACMKELIWNTTWKIMISSLLGVACFSWSTLLIASTKHLKCPSDHHFHVSLPSTTLGLPTHRRQAPTLGRSDLSPRIILDTHLKLLDWLIQVMDLTWWVTSIPSLSHFLSTCLSYFLSTKWFPIVIRTWTSTSPWVRSWSFNLKFKF